jgi:hypothetical protein
VIEIEHRCIFNDCREDVDGSLQARWPDGQSCRREVCLVHIARGVRSLQEFRGHDAGEPIITRVRWRVNSKESASDHLTTEVVSLRPQAVPARAWPACPARRARFHLRDREISCEVSSRR